MQPPFITRATGPLPVVMPRKADINALIKGITRTIEQVAKNMPKTESYKAARAEKIRKLKIMRAEFKALRNEMNQ